MRKIDISRYSVVDGVRLFVDKDYPWEACVWEALAKFVDLMLEYEESIGIDISQYPTIDVKDIL